MPYDRYVITLQKEDDADLVEQALTNANISFSIGHFVYKPPQYITYQFPEHALRAAGFLVWGSQFKLICRLPFALRRIR